MTAVKSISKPKLFKNPFIMARIRTNITTNRKLATVICILHAIGFPLIMALGVYTEYYYEKYKDNDYHTHYPNTDILIVAGFIAGILALLAGFVVAMNIFRYQYKKSCVDMNLSLPLSSTQRFFTDYLTGLGIYLIPALVAWVIGDLIGLIGIGLHLEDMKDSLSIINHCGICVVFAMILFYTLTVFCVTCCGSIFEAIASSVLINGIIPLFLLVFGFCVCNSNPYGVMDDVIMLEQIYFTSPFGCAMFVFQITDNGTTNVPYFWSWLISIIIYIALIVALTYFLYKKRKAESVSKPYVYRMLYYAMTSAMLFIIIYAISLSGDDFIGAIFVGAIIYFLFEVITKRGFKKFHYSVFRFIGTVVSIFIIVAVSDISNGFGIYKYVPNPAGVSQVSMREYGSMTKSFNEIVDYGSNMYSDRNIIRTVTEIQKSYIDQYEHPEKYEDYDIINISESNDHNTINFNNDIELEIRYYMKNGNIVSRRYDILYEDFYKITSAIYTSDEFAEYAEDIIREYYSRYNYDYPLRSIAFSESKTETQYDIQMNKSSLEELITAYQTDLKNMTAEDYCSKQIIGYIGNGLEIRENFENTIAFIKKNRPDFNTDGDNFKLSSFENATVCVYQNVIPVDNIINYNNSSEYRRISERYILMSDRYAGAGKKPFSIGTNTVDAELEKLINVSKNVYDSNETGGMIIINNCAYYIPKEYKELADKVYKKLFGNTVYYYDEDGDEYYINEYGENVYTGYSKEKYIGETSSKSYYD